jgi:hypothetical protein
MTLIVGALKQALPASDASRVVLHNAEENPNDQHDRDGD